MEIFLINIPSLFNKKALMKIYSTGFQKADIIITLQIFYQQ